MVNSQLLEWLSGNEKFVKELGAKNTLNRNLQKKFANEVLSKCKEEMENLFNKQSFTESEIQFLKTLQTKSDTIPNRIAKKMGKACSESGIVRKVFFETMVLQNFESLINVISPESDTKTTINDLNNSKGIRLSMQLKLTPREQKVISLRYGLCGNDVKTKTWEEIAKMFNTSRERIREIEAKAIRKIKNFPKNYSTEDLKKLEEELKKQDEIFLKNLELMDFSDLNTPQEDLQLNKDEKSDPFDDIEDEESEVFDDIEEEEDIHGI